MDFTAASDPSAVLVLLHPHPHMGGDRFHVFVDLAFRRAPDAGLGAVRFDFTSADVGEASERANAGIAAAVERWPEAPVVVGGYSFGAGVAVQLDDRAIAGWFLLAPQATTLARAIIGTDPRPKRVVIAEHDQFSGPADVEATITTWTATTSNVVPGIDHFLGRGLPQIVEDCFAFARGVTPPRS